MVTFKFQVLVQVAVTRGTGSARGKAKLASTGPNDSPKPSTVTRVSRVEQGLSLVCQ